MTAKRLRQGVNETLNINVVGKTIEHETRIIQFVNEGVGMVERGGVPRNRTIRSTDSEWRSDPQFEELVASIGRGANISTAFRYAAAASTSTNQSVPRLIKEMSSLGCFGHPLTFANPVCMEMRHEALAFKYIA